jgi:hypothetical protein
MILEYLYILHMFFYESVACVIVSSVEAMPSIGRCFGWLLPLYAYLRIRVERVDRFIAFMHSWGIGLK